MRIAYVDLSPGIGGSLISLQRLLERLDRPAFEPVMVLAGHNPAVARFREMAIPVVTVPVFRPDTARTSALVRHLKQSVLQEEVHERGLAGRLWSWGRGLRNILTRTAPLTWRLYRALRRIGPALVHINDAVFVSRPAIAAAWLARRPALCHVRSLATLNGWDRLWARTLRGFIFISRWVAEDVGRQIATGDSLRRVIYDGLDPAPYIQAPDRLAARAVLGLPADRPIVAVLGRLVPWKGQDLFLRALRQVVDALPTTLGLVVGEPEIYSLEYGPALRHLAADLGLGEAVRFTGYLQDTPTLLAAIDVLAHTSISPEPFGLVMLEAMAAGRPVVTPAEGGGPEIVVHGHTGLLYEPRNPAALAAAIIQLLSDPARAAAMGEAGRRRVTEAFSPDRFAAEVASFYRELAEISSGVLAEH